MKRRWLVSLLVLVLVLLLAVAAVWRRLPVWIAARIDAALLEKGLISHSTVTALSLRGMQLDLRVTEPFDLTLPTLQLEWKILDLPLQVGFSVRSLEGGPAHETHFKSLHLGAPSLVVDGTWRPGTLRLSRLEGAFRLLAPLVADVEIRPASLESLGGWRASVEIPAQDLSRLVGAALALASDATLEVVIPEGASRGLAVTSESLRFESKFSNSERIGLTLKDPRALINIGAADTPALSLKSDYVLLWQSLRSSGALEWEGASANDFKIRLQDRLVLKDFFMGDYSLGAGSLGTRLEARIKSSRLVSGELSLRGALRKMLYKKVPFEGLSLNTNLGCKNIALSDLGRGAFTKGCEIRAPGLRFEIEKFLDKQPLRGTSVSLQTSSGRAWVVNFSAQWQGAPLKSQRFEFDRDLAGFRMKLVGEKLSLSELILALDSPKITGKGVVNLNADLDWRAEKGLTLEADFESLGVGVVRYIDSALQSGPSQIETLEAFQDLLGRGQQALVLKALEDFHYKKFRAVVTRDPELLMRAELSLSGANPALARSQPFEFNIPIEGDLESLLFNSLLKDFSRREKRSSRSPRPGRSSGLPKPGN